MRSQKTVGLNGSEFTGRCELAHTEVSAQEHRTNQSDASMRGTRSAAGARRGQRGFSLLMIALTAGVMFGMLGLALDAGRMFIVKNELQAFVDASASAACRQMDGTQTGIQQAHTTAISGPLSSTHPNNWNFDQSQISNVTDVYATSFTGTYDNYSTASSSSSNNYRFIKVTANATLPLYFMAVIPGLPTSQFLQASATGGQQASSTLSNGQLLPFAPDAHNQTDTQNFGLIPGQSYTLKWGNGNTTTCAGDSGFTPPGSPPSEHGFVDIGEGNSNSNVRTAIEWGGYPNANSTPSSLYAGESLGGVPGNRGTSIFDSLNARAEQDSNDTSTTYADYVASGTGNGRRIVTVAIGGTWSGSGNNAQTTVLGFANFFLNTSYSGTSGPICATYIGPASMNGNGSGASDGTKIYSVNLFQ
jgi:Flp pilus assembly protein TadG